MITPWHRLSALVLSNLPSDIDERVALLTALTEVMPSDTPLHPMSVSMLTDLQRHLIAQRELCELPGFMDATRGSARLGDRPAKRGSE